MKKVLQGWITRDDFGNLYIHPTKPVKIKDHLFTEQNIKIPKNYFPEEIGKDEAKEVRIEIKLIN